MIEVYPNLFVGAEKELLIFSEEINKRLLKEIAILNVPQYYIIHAAKEPWHRRALGYTTLGAPKDHPEYFYARRGQRLALNLVDTVKYWMIPDKILDEAVRYIYWALQEKNKPVFIHCNEGKSRAPSIALLYLLKYTQLFEACDTFDDVEQFYKTLYPAYFPSGIREKVKEFWDSIQQPLPVKEV